jgi:phospho-N-acetylmuramoyl-pentapeptide-transferase
MASFISRYPTFQVFLAVTVALFLAAVLFPLWIRLLRVRNIGQQVRADGPQGHLVKQGTPTMGGVLILIVVTAVFLTMRLPHRLPLLVLAATLGCGLLGFTDDWAKVARERSLGLRPRAKLAWQAVIAVAFGLVAVNWGQLPTWLAVPLTKLRIPLDGLTTVLNVGGMAIVIPWLYLAFVAFMMIAMSNAVNLTDGLDGLAAGTVAIVMLVYAGISFLQDSLDTAILSAAIAGACIGFLWYNSYPADIFMGDTGSLGLGAALAALAAVTKSELYLPIIGAIYVAETLSVVLQVASFKLTGKRILRMAPLHHHYEMKGWSETKVMVRFWIVTGILAGLGFAMFFVRQVKF